MRLKEFKIGIIVFLMLGMFVLPASAIVLYNVNFVLKPIGNFEDHKTYGSFYLQAYESLYVELETTGPINIQLRYSTGYIVFQRYGMEGDIDILWVVPEDKSYLVYIENTRDVDTTMTGLIYVNSVVTTTTPIVNPLPTGNGNGGGDDVQFILNIVTFIYILAGVLFVISIIVWRKRRNPSYKFLIDVDDSDLLPTDWNPEEEI